MERPMAYCPKAFSLQLLDVALIDVVADFAPVAVGSARMGTFSATLFKEKTKYKNTNTYTEIIF